MLRAGCITTLGFACVGAILGAISYQIEDNKTYDVWTHSIGIGLDFGIVGFLLVVAFAILRKFWLGWGKRQKKSKEKNQRQRGHSG